MNPLKSILLNKNIIINQNNEVLYFNTKPYFIHGNGNTILYDLLIKLGYNLDQNEITINRATVRVIKQNHPGGSFGYRMEDNGKVFVFCTDLEHGDAALPEIIEFCKGADLLVHEAQYTAEELKVHKGWGHSSYEQALEVAEKAGVKKLAITHHDPEHNDTFLTKLEKECQKRFANCVFARENMELTV